MRVKYDDLLYDEYEGYCLGDTPFTGTVVSFFPNGTLKSEHDFVLGFRSGTFRSFFPSGIIEKEWTYKNDTPHGPFVEWFESGQIKEEGERRLGKKWNMTRLDVNGNIVERWENGILIFGEIERKGKQS